MSHQVRPGETKKATGKQEALEVSVKLFQFDGWISLGQISSSKPLLVLKRRTTVQRSFLQGHNPPNQKPAGLLNCPGCHLIMKVVPAEQHIRWYCQPDHGTGQAPEFDFVGQSFFILLDRCPHLRQRLVVHVIFKCALSYASLLMKRTHPPHLNAVSGQADHRLM